jgi:uncharacterized spore protein YtfJ
MTEVAATESSTTTSLEHNTSRLLEGARVDAVFGHPVERGEATVIPCAEVFAGFGMGFGSGTSTGGESAAQAGGQGGGMGGGAHGRPVAVVIIAQDGVRVEPVVDVTKLALAGLTTMGFTLAWLARLASAGRRARAGRPPSPRRLQRMINS